MELRLSWARNLRLVLNHLDVLAVIAILPKVCLSPFPASILYRFFNTANFFCTAPPRQLRNSIRHPFVVVHSDVVEITGLVNFFEAVPDPFIRNQVQVITISMLEMLVRVHVSLTHLGSRGNMTHPLLYRLLEAEQ